MAPPPPHALQSSRHACLLSTQLMCGACWACSVVVMEVLPPRSCRGEGRGGYGQQYLGTIRRGECGGGGGQRRGMWMTRGRGRRERADEDEKEDTLPLVSHCSLSGDICCRHRGSGRP
eukprot:6179253-Pyramimonas_sp.AAC.1